MGSRILKRLTMLCLPLLLVSLVVTAPPSYASCGGVVLPRVRYWCDTVRPATAYTNYSQVGKHYNEMYEGGSLPVGIYVEANGNKFHIINATGYAYKTFQRTTAIAVCWNRSSTRYSSARCDYIKGS